MSEQAGVHIVISEEEVNARSAPCDDSIEKTGFNGRSILGNLARPKSCRGFHQLDELMARVSNPLQARPKSVQGTGHQ
jgi:hypothetical protein